jgi:hypothetical protein
MASSVLNAWSTTYRDLAATLKPRNIIGAATSLPDTGFLKLFLFFQPFQGVFNGGGGIGDGGSEVCAV